MSEALRFWALAEGLGLLALPVAAAFFARLPGRGLALARPLGLLLAAYPAWLLASLHLLPYGTGTALLGILLLAFLGGGLAYRGRDQFRPIVSGSDGIRPLSIWLAGEILFAVAFFGWAVMRCYAPDVWGTEKPMDMAFINAINRSAWFPPHDPWLSGATINYYYLGHYLVAFFIRLTAVPPSVGFNLGVSLFYALCAGAVYGVAAALYGALRARAGAPAVSPLLPGLLAAAFAMLLGNLDGALELLTKPGPLRSFDWWSPSRIIDNGATINEFPFFSFLLADLHAHMLVVPFGLTTLAFALQLALAGPRLADRLGAVPAGAPHLSPNGQMHPGPSTLAADLPAQPGAAVLTTSTHRGSPEGALSGRGEARLAQAPAGAGDPDLDGSPVLDPRLTAPVPGDATPGRKTVSRTTLANSSAGTSTAAVAAPAATALTPAPSSTPAVSLDEDGAADPLVPPPSDATWLPGLAELLLAALLAGSLYALNGWDFPTELGIGYLCLLLWWSQRRPRPAAAALWAAGWTLLSVLLFLPFYRHFSTPAHGLGLVQHNDGLVQFLHDYLLIYGLPVWVAAAAVLARLRGSGIAAKYLAWAAIAALAAFALLASAHLAGLALLLAAAVYALSAAADERLSPPARLWWLLTAVAVGLATVGEVVYVRDAFDGGADYRMNTVFKFGYQAWFVAMVAAGCGAVWLCRRLRGEARSLWLAGLAVLVACSAVYTVAGSVAREGGFHGARTLDGLRWLELQAPGDAAAIRWLQANVRGAPTIAEAVGVQYDPAGHARVSTFTGLPAVVGWPGHEGEWAHDVGTRPDDVKTLYSTTDPALARALLARYGIRYVFVGSLERADYPPPGLAKFAQLGRAVFADGGTIVYEIP